MADTINLTYEQMEKALEIIMTSCPHFEYKEFPKKFSCPLGVSSCYECWYQEFILQEEI